MTIRYRILTLGVQQGHDVDSAAARLAANFQRAEEQMRALLQAPRAVVKKQLDYASALRFQQVLEDCGCLCLIEAEPHEAAGVSAASAASSPPTASAASAQADAPRERDEAMERWLKYNKADAQTLHKPAVPVARMGQLPQPVEEEHLALRSSGLKLIAAAVASVVVFLAIRLA